MLSWTLRRKTAPTALEVDTGVDSPSAEASSPSKSPGGRSKSLSSKGSLSSLFSKSKKDYTARSLDPAELVDVVEGDLYPVYDSTNVDHTSALSQRGRESSPSPVRSRSRSRKSTLRKTGSKSSLQLPRNFLESIASKLKSAAEYFHKDSSSSESSEDSRHSKASSTRSVSPKKSVRFRSGTFSNSSDPASAPIAVPEKTTPRLLHLKLPSGDLLRDVTNEALQDPIPTGRPQETPVLKDKSDSDYFFPFPSEIDQQLADLKGRRGKARPLPLIDLKKRVSEQENPFDDAAALPSPAEKSPAAAEGTESEAAVAVPPDFPRAESLGEEWSKISPSKPPDESSHNRRVESESNVTNPFCDSVASFEETAVPQSTPESNVADIAMPAPPSAWNLESRTVGTARHGDGQDSDDSDSSADTIARLHRSSKPTHEDIRLQFRRRRSKDNPGSSPLTTALDKTVISSPSEVRKRTSDISKLPSSPVCPVVTAEGIVSPLNLTPTGSSSTPTKPRAFRFSNQTPPGAAVDIRPRRSRWSGQGVPEVIPTNIVIDPKRFEDKTPSPVAVPLPLSVAPKQQSTSKWRDQHGWTPFDEPRFPEAFVNNQGIHDMLLHPSGMCQMWKLLGLPQVTAPEDDTRALTPAGIKNMLQFCTYLHSADNVTTPAVGHQLTHRNSMSELFSPYSSDYSNPYAPLAAQSLNLDEVSTADDKSEYADSPSLKRSPRKYSGEVSTNSDASCSQCKSQNESCRCADSTQTTQSLNQEELSSEPALWQAGVRTPTNAYAALALPSQLASLETTPKQSDFVQRSCLQPVRKLSLATTDTNTTQSDEEQYVRGII